MADWVAERRGEDVPEEAQAFSVARLVRGLAGFGWQEAEQEHRAVIESGTDAQGAIVAPVGTAATVIDRIRANARVLEAGATLIPMDTRQVTVPKLAGGVQGQWRAEMGSVSFQDPSFTGVTLAAKSLAVGLVLSSEFVEDATSAGLQALENEIIQAIANGLDLGALRGDGTSNSPTGIRNQAGVNVRPNGTNGTAIVNHSILVDAAYQVRQRGYTPSAFILSPHSEMKFGTLADPGGQPLKTPEYLAGVPRLESLAVPENLTVGTSIDTTEVYCGQFAHCYVGVRPEFGVRVERQSDLSNLSVKIVAHLRADVALAHPGAFAVETGVR